MRGIVVGLILAIAALNAEAQLPTLTARLTMILDSYVATQGVGYLCHQGLRLQLEGVDVEPALVVRQPHPDPRRHVATAPVPMLIVEIVSVDTAGDSRRRGMYMSAGVVEYWLVDLDARTITVARAGRPDLVARDQLTWWPPGADAPLTIDVRSLFS